MSRTCFIRDTIIERDFAETLLISHSEIHLELQTWSEKKIKQINYI